MLSAELIDNKTQSVLKKYLFEESADRIAWLFAIFGDYSKDLDKADYLAQNKLSEALSRQILFDASKFKECKTQTSPLQNKTNQSKLQKLKKSQLNRYHR